MSKQEDEAKHSLVESVIRRAFPHPDGDELLDESRRHAIQERIGIVASDPEAVAPLEETLQALGFDATMSKLLIRDHSAAEIGLFLAHAGRLLAGDFDRSSAVPRELRVEPGFRATFNQAKKLVERDCSSIDKAIAELTGQPRRGRPR